MTSMLMIMLFLFAAVLLNLTNYVLYLLNPPVRNVRTKVLSHKRSVPHSKLNNDFTAKLLCGSNNEDLIKRNTVDDNYNELTPSTRGLFTYYFMRTKLTNMKLCPEIPSDLGPVQNDPSLSTLEAFDRIYTEVQIGGSFIPDICTARQIVAIIIPYRASNKVNNGKHLGTFLYMLHPFLMKQQLAYQVFVVEQANPSQRFNHGKLLNAGFSEVQRRLFNGDHFHCIIIHEPHIVPLDTRNLYRCGRYPRQLAVTVERSDKLQNASYHIDRNRPDIGQYKTLKNYDLPWIKKSSVAQTSSPMNLIDGLTTLSYTLNSFELKYIFTHINITLEDENTAEDQSQIVEIVLQNTSSKNTL